MTTKQPVAVEHKVVTTTTIAGVVGITLAALNGIEANSQLINWLPPTWQTIIIATLPALLTFLGGYATPHTERPDIGSKVPKKGHTKHRTAKIEHQNGVKPHSHDDPMVGLDLVDVGEH